MTRIAATFRGRARRAAVLSALSLILASSAWAAPVRKGWVFDQNVQAAYNPLGAQLGTKIFYRAPLSEKGGILWESTKIDIGLKNSLSPAYDMAGIFIDVLPIAIFDLAFSAQAIGYFDALGYGFRSMPDYEADFSEEALEGIARSNAFGVMLTANPTLQLAFGPVVLMDSLNANFFRVDDGEGYFYEATGNCILKKEDIQLVNDAYALYTFNFGLMLGVNDTILYVPGSKYSSHCLQAIGVYSSSLSEGLSLYAALMGGVYLKDPYLQGEAKAAGQVGITLEL